MTAWVELYTDGACKGNPGPGGWGVIMCYLDREKELFGAEAETTNNRMELMAAIQGLTALTRPCRVRVFTDSSYVQKGMTEWLSGWKQKNWKTASKQDVKNADLWQQLDQAAQKHLEVQWEWVKGHAGHPMNERADQLANKGVESLFNQTQDTHD